MLSPYIFILDHNLLFKLVNDKNNDIYIFYFVGFYFFKKRKELEDWHGKN